MNYIRKNISRMWYNITNESEIFTPAVLVYPDRIKENINRIIAIAGNVSGASPGEFNHFHLVRTLSLKLKRRRPKRNAKED